MYTLLAKFGPSQAMWVNDAHDEGEARSLAGRWSQLLSVEIMVIPPGGTEPVWRYHGGREISGSD
jgi:hypothetical protein